MPTLHIGNIFHVARSSLPRWLNCRFDFDFPSTTSIGVKCVEMSFFTLQEIVVEKSSRLRETMKMMGLNSSLNFLSWFIKQLLFWLIACVGVTIIISVSTILILFLERACFCARMCVVFIKVGTTVNSTSGRPDCSTKLSVVWYAGHDIASFSIFVVFLLLLFCYLQAGGVFPISNGFLIFLFFLVYFISAILFLFMVRYACVNVFLSLLSSSVLLMALEALLAKSELVHSVGTKKEK